MVRFSVNMEKITPLTRKQSEYLVQVSARFAAKILLNHNHRTVNGKSMLGLLALGATGTEPVLVEVEGRDEKEAAETLRSILTAGIISPRDASDAEELLVKIKTAYLDILGEDLSGMYVHGSLAWGCFCWEKSDIDILLVLRREPDAEKKKKLLKVLAEAEKDAPPKGFEMCVMLEADCSDIKYPTPFVLHYSAMHAQAFREDPDGYVKRMHGEDPDIVCHIAEARAACDVLLGPGPARMFSSPKPNDLMSSIRQDIEQSTETVLKEPVYVILNICRTLAFIREGMMMSKLSGGEWALKNLDTQFQALIQAAINAYKNGTDMSFDPDMALDFTDRYVPGILRGEACT